MQTLKLIKKNGKLTYLEPKDKLAYEIFEDKIQEGQKVDMYLDFADADHSKAQLAKVHACIRELAKEIGYTFDEMKTIIKEQSGLCMEQDGIYECKSFADCSKDELLLAIEACIEIGKEVNINLQ
ncbi:MAG: hypothetical protein NTY55_02760 [Flavobacteriia bacterium]|nr:hypothetical protein [Flavobacteriia bacterium]